MIGHLTSAQLSAYLDGEGTFYDSRGIEGHLASCGDCRDRFESIQRTIRGLERPLGLSKFIRGNVTLKGSVERDNDSELGQGPQHERVDFPGEEFRFDEPPPPLLDHLRHLLQTRLPVLYAQVLEPTLADLREEHSSALAEGHPFKARCVLLQGCGALAAAAICQFGYSFLGRIAALWQARSPK